MNPNANTNPNTRHVPHVRTPVGISRLASRIEHSPLSSSVLAILGSIYRIARKALSCSPSCSDPSLPPAPLPHWQPVARPEA